jgi:hypothetical protein
MKTPKIVAVDYKGKYFTLQDEDTLDPAYDFVLEYVDVDKTLNDSKLLRQHVEHCRYYGIPAYHGSNKVLNAKIEEIEQELFTNE